jgi:hypothetical protein
MYSLPPYIGYGRFRHFPSVNRSEEVRGSNPPGFSLTPTGERGALNTPTGGGVVWRSQNSEGNRILLNRLI